MKKIDELLTIIYSYRKAQLLYIAAKLKIADILSDGPKNYVEIAKKDWYSCRDNL